MFSISFSALVHIAQVLSLCYIKVINIVIDVYTGGYIMNEIAQFISQIGFPIFVAVWMLYKTSKDSQEMRESINDLKNAITLLTSEVGHHNKGGDNDEQ